MRGLFECGDHIGKAGRKWTPIVVGHEHQRFLLPLTGRRYGMAFHGRCNGEARPDITIAIDQTIVDRLVAVA